LNITSYYKIAIVISRRYMRTSRAFIRYSPHSTTEDNAYEDKAQIIAGIVDEQAGHSSYIAGAVYTRETIK
jgi:hypothetical protein